MMSDPVIYTCPACNTDHAGVLVNPHVVDGETIWDVKPILDCPGCGLKPDQVDHIFGDPSDDDLAEIPW